MGTKDDARVTALNEYVLKLEQELKDKDLVLIKQAEYLIEQENRRKKVYEKIAKGKQLDPINPTDAQYYLEQIESSIVGLYKTINNCKESIQKRRRNESNS